MAKAFGLIWAFEPIQDDPSFFSKRMFGGLATYLHGKMIMVLMENHGERSYRGQSFEFDSWNGIFYDG